MKFFASKICIQCKYDMQNVCHYIDFFVRISNWKKVIIHLYKKEDSQDTRKY